MDREAFRRPIPDLLETAGFTEEAAFLRRLADADDQDLKPGSIVRLDSLTWWKEDDWTYRCNTALGGFMVAQDDDGADWRWRPYPVSDWDTIEGPYDSPEKAMKAFEAEYFARLRRAFKPLF